MLCRYIREGDDELPLPQPSQQIPSLPISKLEAAPARCGEAVTSDPAGLLSSFKVIAMIDVHPNWVP